MARFHIIDQSLCHQGGHHFDYANCIAGVAVDSGYETYVATNRKFKVRDNDRPTNDSMLGSARIAPVFRHTTYQRSSWLAGLRHLKRSKVILDKNSSEASNQPIYEKLVSWMGNRRTRLKRRRLIAKFAQDLRTYFETLACEELDQDDHIFFTTVSELELMGLAIFLANSPWTEAATWHLQFHYNLFDGRTPEFDSQTEVLGKVRGCFLAALSRVPHHDLHFYCTAEELVEQYDRINVVKFKCLPYPINPKFEPAIHTRPSQALAVHAVNQTYGVSSQPPYKSECGIGGAFDDLSKLRMICPGELRREKGIANHLQSVISNLWNDYFETGKLEVAVQRPRKKPLRAEKVDFRLPNLCEQRLEPIHYLQHPLSESDYVKFIRKADFGLLLYDSRAYFSRRAGVLGELLACGKPVIVPAGCWLAHQLQELQFNHIENLLDTIPVSRTIGLSDLEINLDNAPLGGGLVSFDHSRHPFDCQLRVRPDESIAVVEFEWHSPLTEGVDTSVKCTSFDQSGIRIHSSTQVVGHRRHGNRCYSLFRIGSEARTARFSLSNAFHNSMATIRNLSIQLLRVADCDTIPLGSVGLIAAKNESAETMVAEMVNHFDHYRESAEAFSHSWYQNHDPARTLEFLTGYTARAVQKAA